MTTRPVRLGRTDFIRYTPVATRWADADVYGHVNNAVYYQLFDTAVNGPLVSAGLLDPASSDSVFLVVDSGCSYFQELRFPDLLEVGVAVTRLGRTAVTYAVGLFREHDSLAAAQGHFVHVNVNRISREPQPIDDSVKRYLETLVRQEPENSERTHD